jgi:hypothetical protein
VKVLVVMFSLLFVMNCGRKVVGGSKKEVVVEEEKQVPVEDSSASNEPQVETPVQEEVAITTPEQPVVEAPTGPTGTTGDTEEEETPDEDIDGTLVCKNGKSLMCHYPPDNLLNEHEICVSKNSVAEHELYGDKKGECPNED